MSRAIGYTGAALDLFLEIAGGFLLAGFLFWSFFLCVSPNYNASMELFMGPFFFILSCTLAFFLHRVPFGIVCTPFLIEWLWHGHSIGEFTAVAWMVTGLAMAPYFLMTLGCLLSSNLCHHDNLQGE